MSSVTQRISEIKQPMGGYLPLSKMNITEIQDNRKLADNENLHPSIIGMVVDYYQGSCQGLLLRMHFLFP